MSNYHITAPRYEVISGFSLFIRQYEISNISDSKHASARLILSSVARTARCNLDLRGGVLSIHRLKGSLFTIQELERHRGIPLLDEVRALREWLAVRPVDCGDALFTSQKGGHLTSTQFYRIFRQTARNAGLPDHMGHPQVLKHTLATHMVRRDVNLAKVQRALGHRSINSTMIYVGVSDKEADSARHNALMNAF